MFLRTSDNVKIAYDWYPVDQAIGYLVLIHMMPAVKESWKDFMAQVQKQGWAGIAVDLRGHGASDGGPYGYKNFSDLDHQKSILDLGAAVEFLKTKGAETKNIAFVGASIGANLALKYIMGNPDIKTAVLLSAGLNYRGIETEPLVKKLKTGQKVFFIGSWDDEWSGGNSVEMNKKLFNTVPSGVKKDLLIYKQGGHGTEILNSNRDSADKILNFLNTN